jgi:hypothetical protein
LSGLAFTPGGVDTRFGPILMKLTETSDSPIWSSTHMIVGVERGEALVLSSGNVIASDHAEYEYRNGANGI